MLFEKGLSMKKISKILLFVLSALQISYLQAMEEPKKPESEEKFFNWQNLPEEIKVMILSFIPQVSNYQDFVNLARTNSELNRLINDKMVLRAFFKKFIQEKPRKASEFFEQALENKNKQIASAFIKSDPLGQKLANAALRHFPSLETAKFLLDNGADANTKDTEGDHYPLAIAVQSKKNAVIQLLIDYGANINLQDSWSLTPLMYAVIVFNGNPSIIKLLLSHGADVDIVTENGTTVFDWAKSIRNETHKAKVLEMLTAAKAAKEAKK